MAKPAKFGRICNAGGRRIELISEFYEWNDWANDWLNVVAGLETAVRLNDQEAVKRFNLQILATVQKNVPK